MNREELTLDLLTKAATRWENNLPEVAKRSMDHEEEADWNAYFTDVLALLDAANLLLLGDVRAVLDFMGVAFRETKMCVVHGAPHDHHMITEKCRVAVRIETVVEDSE